MTIQETKLTLALALALPLLASACAAELRCGPGTIERDGVCTAIPTPMLSDAGATATPPDAVDSGAPIERDAQRPPAPFVTRTVAAARGEDGVHIALVEAEGAIACSLTDASVPLPYEGGRVHIVVPSTYGACPRGTYAIGPASCAERGGACASYRHWDAGGAMDRDAAPIAGAVVVTAYFETASTNRCEYSVELVFPDDIRVEHTFSDSYWADSTSFSSFCD
jgi:hypothetical protein